MSDSNDVIYGATEFSTEGTEGPVHAEFPFWNVGERSCKLYTQKFRVDASAYQPLPLDTPYEEDTKARLVEESPPLELEGDVIEFTRKWARVPGEWEEPRMFSWARPGVSTTASGAELSVASFNFYEYHRDDAIVSALFGGYDRAYVSRITFGPSVTAGLAVNQFLRLSLAWKPVSFSGGGYSIYYGGGRWNTLVQIKYIAGDSVYFEWLGNRKPDSLNVSKSYNRQPRGVNVIGKAVHSYVVAPTIDSALVSIQAEQPFALYSPAGTETDTVTDTSSPNWATWAAMAGQWLLVEPPRLERWMGNIWHVERIYVKAQ